MKLNRYSIIVGLLLLSLNGFAQEILTKERALEITLENNFGIKIAKNNLEIAENNTSIYNSGKLPTATLNSGANYSRNNQSLTFTDRDTGNDSEISGNGVVAKTYNASLGVNYTIFDGFGRKYNVEQLKQTYNLTELQARETIENTYLQLFTTYFQIARLSENTDNLAEALTISKQRLQRAQYQYDYGQSTKLEFLNAQVDVNNDSISLIAAKQQLNNAKRGLNVILGKETATNFSVETNVEYNNMLSFEDLKIKTMQNNSLLKQNEQNIAISEFNVKINKATYLPSLNFNASYGYNRTRNENLINPFGAKLITSDGLNAGLNLTWNIFDGGSTKTRVANAKIALDNQQILLEQQKLNIENNLKNTWENYKNQLFILSAQEQNVQSNQNNFDRTQERFKLGQISSVEFRQAQINLINAKTALNNAKFDAKLIELQLLQLSGDILNVKL
ncbi:TolC family protein [Polaribacter dokdonensis]|uniref:Outer membrane efflux protein n=1 Tax=Polaribacter dokdonensis DSW-5 TaxID=1300348 RepID=A0A0M9CG85_9FLAO|nr:TolC family protein [Polaribacter dokdonensis]KOY51295.1 Outer membrane efflux protein [Polaribacter dokdonensis DSW-5]SEE14487.1 Outer membrane protein TolC [Polaribacter dokdonensis DSW-5]